jgi:hypothetical protein
MRWGHGCTLERYSTVARTHIYDALLLATKGLGEILLRLPSTDSNYKTCRALNFRCIDGNRQGAGGVWVGGGGGGGCQMMYTIF